MKQRCYNINLANYRNYGGIGIKVCDRWKDNFDNFLDDMGLAPSKKHMIGRKEGKGDYTPKNCKWVTREENNKHKRKPAKQRLVSEEEKGAMRKMYNSGFTMNEIALYFKRYASTVLYVVKPKSIIV